MKKNTIRLLLCLFCVAVMSITANAQYQPTATPTLENARRAFDALNYTECISILDRCRAAGNWSNEHALLYDDATYLRDVDQLISSTNNLQNVSTATQAQVCEKFLQRNGSDEQYADKVKRLLVDYYVKTGNQTKALNYITEEEWNTRRAPVVKQQTSSGSSWRRSSTEVDFGFGLSYGGYLNDFSGFSIPLNLRIGEYDDNFNALFGVTFQRLKSAGSSLDSMQYINVGTGSIETCTDGSNGFKLYQFSFSAGGRVNLSSTGSDLVYFLQGDVLANLNVGGRMTAPKWTGGDDISFKVGDGLRPLTFGVQGTVGLATEKVEAYIGIRYDFSSPLDEEFFNKEYFFDVSSTSDQTLYELSNTDKLSEVSASGRAIFWRAQNLMHSSSRFESLVTTKIGLYVGLRIYF